MAESARVDVVDIYTSVPTVLDMNKDLGPNSTKTDAEQKTINAYLLNKKKKFPRFL